MIGSRDDMTGNSLVTAGKDKWHMHLNAQTIICISC